MKKILLVLSVFISFSSSCIADGGDGFALYQIQKEELREQQLSEIVVMEVNGKLYYIDNLGELLSEKNKNTCIYSTVNGDINTLYKRLLDNCRQTLAREGTSNVGLANKYYSFLSRLGNTKKALEYCLINVDSVRKSNNEEKKEYSASIFADLDKCVSSIKVHKDVNSCPVDFSVSDIKHKENMYGLNDRFVNKKFKFTEQYNGTGNLIGIFNGYIMVVCDKDRPVYLVKPSFSGAARCQGGNFETIPYMGSLPSGVYMAKRSKLQAMEESNWAGWGKYRIPLMPATVNDTYGRGSFFLHGTSNEEKHSSGGCISLGTGIADFVEDFYARKSEDLLIIVDLVPNVEQEWNK